MPFQTRIVLTFGLRPHRPADNQYLPNLHISDIGERDIEVLRSVRIACSLGLTKSLVFVCRFRSGCLQTFGSRRY